MKRLALIALLVAQPALANDYLIQYPGYPVATELRTKSPQPQPGVDCETGSSWAPWVPVGGDTTIQDYTVNANHSLTHMPPPAPGTVTPQPDPLSAEKAIRADVNISLTAKLELAKYKSVLDAYPQDVTGVQQMWAGIKAADAAISPAEQAEVESVCAQFNMPLVVPQPQAAPPTDGGATLGNI